MFIEETLKLIGSYIGISESEKKLLGEVFTPFELINEMLDTLPSDVWSNPNLKWLDPANGIGNFPIIIVKRLMEGLKDFEPDINKRYHHIMNNMIYVCDINPKNMFIYNNLFNPENNLKLNTYRGSFLDDEFDNHMKNMWKVDKFNIVVGNPPYQEKVGPSKTKSLWNFFIKKIDNIINYNGYMIMIHPSGWRSLDGEYKDIQNILKSNLIYLSMNDDKEGQKVFGATTSFDWYLYSKTKINKTKIKYQNDKIIDVDLSNLEFIPNGEFELFDKLIAKNDEEKVNVLHSYSSYETRKDWMSKERTEEFKYPCIYTITKDNTINLFWSKINTNGHFGIPKIIWSNGMASQPTIDDVGKYGLTQFSYAIVDDLKNLYNIKKCMDSEKFINLMKLCYMSSGNRFDKKVISIFKKDFWKEFI